MNRFVVGCTLVLLTVPMTLRAQAPLPVVEDVEWGPLRGQIQKLLKGLEEIKSPLPAETTRELEGLLEKEEATPQAVEAVQKLLDAHCLVGISINPESRVKAARGPASAALSKERETVVLLKVHNEAGVTQSLSVSGPQITTAAKPEESRWLKAVVANGAPFPRRLSGGQVDYLVLKLTPLEAGKREATLKFDAGQGTQDLGFRAEVPILFIVK